MALLLAFPLALLPAGPAHAEERTVSGGRLDWGIKSSFQSYVTGPIAEGRWALEGGAATAGESTFRFHSAKGGYDPSSGAFHASFSGGVHFTGHEKPDGTHELDLTISRPTVRVNGGSGTLYADIRSKAKGTGKVTSGSQVPFASLDLGGVNMRGGTGPVALSRVPAKLTAEGAKSFAGYYTAGTTLDPVNLSADVKAPAAKSGGSAEKGKKKEKEKKKAKKETPGRIEDAAVDWGVRRTFREYVTGSLAKGKWKLSGGAQDGGALFRFPQGKGDYDAKASGDPSLDADFAGTVHFTGKELDLSLSHVSVTVEDGKGTLSADVADGEKGSGTEKDQALITFEAKKSQLKPDDGLITLTEVPAVLTKAGAEAFGGMYAKGTRMDPLSLAVALDDKAELPALPDLGSGADTADSTAASASPKATADDRTENTASSSAVPLAATGAGVAVLLAAAATFVAVRRKRGAGGSD